MAARARFSGDADETEELDCLARRAEGRRVVVEIGVFQGVSLARLRATMDPAGVLFAVDPFFRGRLGVCWSRPIARGEVKPVGGARVVWLRCRGNEAPARFRVLSRNSADLVFIDADHSYDGVRRDWEAWRPLIAPGGLVAFHDAAAVPEMPRHLREGSVRFVEDVVARDRNFEPVETAVSLRIFRRRT